MVAKVPDVLAKLLVVKLWPVHSFLDFDDIFENVSWTAYFQTTYFQRFSWEECTFFGEDYNRYFFSKSPSFDLFVH